VTAWRQPVGIVRVVDPSTHLTQLLRTAASISSLATGSISACGSGPNSVTLDSHNVQRSNIQLSYCSRQSSGSLRAMVG
jgi:hypothetical protein